MRDVGEGNLQWGDVMEECKRELSCVCRPMAQTSDEDSEEDAPEGRRAHPRHPWIAPINLLVERDPVWGGYIDPNTKGRPLS